MKGRTLSNPNPEQIHTFVHNLKQQAEFQALSSEEVLFKSITLNRATCLLRKVLSFLSKTKGFDTCHLAPFVYESDEITTFLLLEKIDSNSSDIDNNVVSRNDHIAILRGIADKYWVNQLFRFRVM
jgi:hypothetical protein